jgi:uncharacterized secreted protein with C-terminal beta-propeller domain
MALALTSAAALLVAGCGQAPRTAGRRSASVVLETPKPTARPKHAKASVLATGLLRQFRDCAAITRDLRAEALRYVGPYGLPTGYGGGPQRTFVTMRATPGGAKDASAAPAAASAQPGVDYSQTNVQEAGVDEPDTVKTDGNHIFVVAGQTLRAAAVDGGHPRLVGRLNLSGYGFQLLLAGNRLIVLSGDQQIVQPMMRPVNPGGGPGVVPGGGDRTLVQIVDVSNPAAMRVVSTLRLDGNFVAARQIDGVARIVIQRSSPGIGFTYPQDSSKAALDDALSTNRNAVLHAAVAQWIPRYRLEAPGMSKKGALSSCAETYRPAIFSGFATVTVVTVDPTNPVPRAGSTVVGGGSTVYASRSNLYVTSQRLPAPIPLALNRPADIVPIADQTQIHEFDITGPSAAYVASGVVGGTLLNQFSMSEFGGNLRVATTSGPVSEIPSQSISESSITVLAPRGSTLTRIGHLAGLGVGQRINAVRFIGAVAYVVTFRQIDPLYTIDLSNPRLPRVAGQLHIPGFSSYLHPIGNGLLLGVGEEVDAHARPIGTKVSLFDVSDIAHPRQVQKLSIGGPNFQSEFDHHAFLWWAPSQLAVLPLQTYSTQPDGKGETFNGAVTLEVEGSTNMRQLRRLTQPGNAQQMLPIIRSLVASGLLFTVSDAGLMASDLGSLNQRAWLPFA